MTSDPHPNQSGTHLMDLQRHALIGRLIDQLVYDYEGVVDRDKVEATFRDSYARLMATAKVTTFVPGLAERLTRERLEALAQVDGSHPKRVPEVVFVCVHNAGRSQMAAALARHYGGSHLHIRTGGSAPGARINPDVAHAMKEIGLSLDEEFPKPLTEEVLAAADVVITMGCGDECPYLPGRRYEDWPIADPAQATDADQITGIRDDIDTRVRDLIASLLPDLTLSPLKP